MEKETDEKTCYNCALFFPHYAKHKRKITRTSCGHCRYDRLGIERNIRAEKARKCAHWQQRSEEEEKKNREQTIKETLREIQRSLNDIALILKDDED